MRPTLLCALALSPALAAAEVTVASPDGRVLFRLTTDGGRLTYAVTFGGKTVIEPSPPGIVVDGAPLGDAVELGAAERYEVNETYAWNGAYSSAVNRCQGAKVAVKHTKSGTAYTFEIRAYNDGVAFRHIVPGAGQRVPDEAASFRVPAGSVVWYHDLQDHYEAFHVRKGLRAVPPGQWVAPPLTVRLPEGLGYAAITEGALANYSGMVLQAGEEGVFHARLGHAVPPSYPFRLRYKADVEKLARPAAVNGTITTPWRVVMIAADLNGLINCAIVPNVSPPPDPKLFPEGSRTDWIKPGRSVWAYLDGGDGTLKVQKEFSRMAAELGFEYNVLEGYWARWPESDLKELVDYSRGLGVGILLWKHSNGLRDAQSVRTFYELCRRTGAVGAKIDFFDHEHKDVVDLYHTLLRAAAEYKLVLNFHGANKPAGESRTWPNELTREAIRGMEMGPPRAQHNATLPFTRMLAGQADYTPVHFGRRLSDTTWTHQIASAAVFTSPLLIYGAHPANLLAHPAVDMIKSIPSTWDETLALPASDIGQVAALARRKGDTWFVAVLNGPDARTIRVDLSFLASGSYQSMLVRDTGEADAVQIKHITMTRNDALYIRLRSGGGFIGRFVK